LPSLFLSFLRVEVVVIVVVVVVVAARRFPCYTTPAVLVRLRVVSPPCRYSHLLSLCCCCCFLYSPRNPGNSRYRFPGFFEVEVIRVFFLKL
jgi:hypothetical protein